MTEDELLSHKEVARETILNLEEAMSLFYRKTKEIFEKHGWETKCERKGIEWYQVEVCTKWRNAGCQREGNYKADERKRVMSG